MNVGVLATSAHAQVLRDQCAQVKSMFTNSNIDFFNKSTQAKTKYYIASSKPKILQICVTM